MPMSDAANTESDMTAHRTPLVKESSSAALVAGMGSCYALGTFTDNFYKQAAILLAASTQMTSVQSIATMLFSLPFILFSAWAGWLADRMVKKHIVIVAKSMELLALVLGGFMLVQGEWSGILAVIFIMGTQATLFSPAINGSIPENFTSAQVPRVNSLIKLASTAAILAGMALAGFFLDLGPSSFGGLLPDPGQTENALTALPTAPDGPAPLSVYGRSMASLFIIVVAVLGLLTAFTLRSKPAAGDKATASPFPWTGPLDSLRHTLACRKDPSLFLVLLAEAWFYGIAAVAVISVANLAAVLGYSSTIASLMSAVLMIGIAAGALIAGGRSAESWRKLLLPSASAMGLALILISLAPHLPRSGLAAGLNPQLCWIFLCLGLCGLFGGIYLIPLSSYIQIRPAAHEKGRVLAVSNFLSFVAMALFGAAFQLISLLPPALTFAFYGLATLAAAWLFAARRLRATTQQPDMQQAAANPLGLLLRAVLSLRYSVASTGLEGIAAPQCSASPAPGILFLPNHPALIDPLLVYSRLAGLKPRPLADERQVRGPVQKMAAGIVRAVTIPDLQKDGKEAAAGVRAALGAVVSALKKGDNILLYPAGRINRSARESMGANSGVARILEELPDLRVVLVRTTGLWGSSFSYAGGVQPTFMSRLARGILCVLVNGLFFTPRRKVRMEFVEPRDLPRDGGKLRLNAYLDAFYACAEQAATRVPTFFWQGAAPRIIEEQHHAPTVHNELSVPEDVRETVYSLIRQAAELPADQPLHAEQALNGDLYLDSLSVMELVLSLEAEFNCSIPSIENLITVGDCLRAAVGRPDNIRDAYEHVRIPAAWSALDKEPEGRLPLAIPPAANSINDAFLRMVRIAPARPWLADSTGVRSRKDILTSVLALSLPLRALPEKRLGIMLPAVPAALVVWLAALLAGKEPVLLNWTVGQRNLHHSLELTGIRHAVTSSALLKQLARVGNTVADAPLEWLALEELAAGLSVVDKVRAAARANLHCLGLVPVRARQTKTDIAAILLTSGSESNPKAVPLSHGNIMTNAADVIAALQLEQRERLLAMLPPFHSFGLMAGLALPALTGLSAVYHPNPTESAALLVLARSFAPSLLGATPTFLEAMLKRAQGGSDMASFRFVFTGAEKCPAHVYRAFARCCPGASLCEGYGITECSPVVSVNRPGKGQEGSIGHALSSVLITVVKEEETGERARVKPGETGMLLVRGPSIFSGYLGQATDPFVVFEGERWYRTGDLVAEDADGRLTFKGRLKRFVKLGGEMISLPQMEELLQQALKARPDLPEDGKPFVAIEVRPGSEEAGQAEILAFTTLPLLPEEVNRLFREAGLSTLYAVKRVVRLPEIPLLGTGKTDYRALQAML